MPKAKNTTTIEPTNEWEIIHILGYGKTKINNTTLEKSVSTLELQTAQPLIDFIYGKKPADTTASSEFHVITIAKDLYARFIPKANSEKFFAISFTELDKQLFDNFLIELQQKATEENQ